MNVETAIHRPAPGGRASQEAAIALDAIVLSGFGAMKLQSDSLIVAIAAVAMAAAFAYGRVFLARWTAGRQHGDH